MSVASENLRDAMGQMVTPDLGLYIDALTKLMEEIDSLARDDNSYPGWSAIVDINRCPDEGIEWLGQFVGVVIPAGTTDADARTLIISQQDKLRGTPGAIIRAAQLHLTGTKQVTLRERFGDPYFLQVITRTGETPNPTQSLADIMTQKPAGIVLTYTVMTGQDYLILFTNKATYDAVTTGYVTYQGVTTDQAGV